MTESSIENTPLEITEEIEETVNCIRSNRADDPEAVSYGLDDLERQISDLQSALEGDCATKESVSHSRALIDLIAIIRDRQLGYPPSEELHMDPVNAIENGLEVLDELGTNPDEVVFPDDQETLGIEKTWSEQAQAEN